MATNSHYNCSLTERPFATRMNLSTSGAIQRYVSLIAMTAAEGLFLVRVVSDNWGGVIGLRSEDLFELRGFTNVLTRKDKKQFVFRCCKLMANPPLFHAYNCQTSSTALRGAPIPLLCALYMSRDSNQIKSPANLSYCKMFETSLLIFVFFFHYENPFSPQRKTFG